MDQGSLQIQTGHLMRWSVHSQTHTNSHPRTTAKKTSNKRILPSYLLTCFFFLFSITHDTLTHSSSLNHMPCHIYIYMSPHQSPPSILAPIKRIGDLPHLSTRIEKLPPGVKRVVVGFNMFTHDIGPDCAKVNDNAERAATVPLTKCYIYHPITISFQPLYTDSRAQRCI